MSDNKGFPGWMAWIASHKWGSTFTRLFYRPLDLLVYRVSGGRRGLSPRRAVLYLTTIGRKTGTARRVPVLYLRDGDRYWVVASNFGRDRHPGWSANLLAHPEATVQVGRRSHPVRARLAGRDEKERLWPRLIRLYPAWKNYVEWTDRDFRLFCLEPL